MKTEIQKSKTIFRAELMEKGQWKDKWIIWSSRTDRPEREPHEHLILNTKGQVEEFFKETQKDFDSENEIANGERS